MAGPEERKGERTPGGAEAGEASGPAAARGEGGGPEREGPGVEEAAPREAGAPELDIDRREDEGYDQPESSAQKGTPRGR